MCELKFNEGEGWEVAQESLGMHLVFPEIEALKVTSARAVVHLLDKIFVSKEFQKLSVDKMHYLTEQDSNKYILNFYHSR